MKKVTNLCLSLMLLTGGALLSAGALAHLSGNAPSAPEKLAQGEDSITIFWEKFKAAVIKGNKETVAALSQFPISLNDGMTPIRNKVQFMKRYRFLFFGETNAAKCFPKAKPLVEKELPREFTVSCSFAKGGGEEEPLVYAFTLTRNGWRFTGFENINE